MLKIILSILLILLLIPVIYVTVDLIRANFMISDIIKKAQIKESPSLEISDLSAHQLTALLKVEDPNFYNHKGIDFKLREQVGRP